MKKATSHFRTLWEKVPKWLQDVLTFITSLASLIGLVYGGAKLLIKIIAKFVPKSPLSLPWLICIFLLIIIMFMRAKVKQYKESLWVRRESDAINYYNVLHDFRNFYFDVLTYHKDKKLNKDFLTSITRNFLINLLDKLCNIYTAYTGKTVNACIKLIGKENEDVNFDKIDKENATVYTFIRSSNITKQREDASDNKPVLISKNTDFSYIIAPPDFYQKQYFYEQDLQLFNEKLQKYQQKYENTSENYWNFYRAAIVVPIRIAHSHLHFTSPADSVDYHIVGFLCIDTMSTQSFIPEYEEQFIQIAKSFAAIIYIIMNKYNFYLQKCKNGYTKQRKRTKSMKGVNTDDSEIKP
jgi:hypothetical protein